MDFVFIGWVNFAASSNSQGCRLPKTVALWNCFRVRLQMLLSRNSFV